ncbi:DUF2993 domain-containing protein [Streptomyces sp. NPDC048182]|uniref:LmeA family phospholipid-binding protein n=1 Tax=Streptomyces sp. NPDC048182 TaxID=3365507 RepID=UPI00371972FC
MRAVRILVVLVVILGGLFVLADRLAVNWAEDKAADQIRTTENLPGTPDVSINGFPFLTQLAGDEFHDVEVGIADYPADTGDGKKLKISDLKAHLKGVRFSDDYSTATADSATGTALITYDELLKATRSEPTEVGPGINAKVTGLGDGGDGKIKVTLDVTVLGIDLPQPVQVLGSLKVKDDHVDVTADGLPDIAGRELAEQRLRAITDFDQTIKELPGGVKLDTVRAAKDGVAVTVKGTDVRLEPQA